jgi:hypothetical protein
MSKKISWEDRNKRIQEMMEVANVPEDKARFMVAIDIGEIPGDVLEVDDSRVLT